MTNKPNSGTVSVSRELLACPFCGSPDVKIVTCDGIHFAQCCKCEATGPTGFKRGDEDDLDWNCRAQPADQHPELTPEHSEQVRTLAADQQGEPVACAYCGGDGFHAVPRTSGTDCEACNGTGHAQPATAKVVLPERKREATEDSDIMIDCQNEGWNACLDEVAKLNTPQ